MNARSLGKPIATTGFPRVLWTFLSVTSVAMVVALVGGGEMAWGVALPLLTISLAMLVSRSKAGLAFCRRYRIELVFPVLEQLMEEQARLAELVGSGKSYLALLRKHSVEAPGLEAVEVSEKRLQEAIGHHVRHPLENVDEVLLAVLRELGNSAIRERFPDLPVETADILVCLSLALDLEGHPEARAQVCREMSSQPEAVRMALAYLDLKEDLSSEQQAGEAGGLTLVRLVGDFTGKLARREKELGEGFAKELGTVREQLASGQWPSRLAVVITRTLDVMTRSHEQFNQLLEIVAARPGVGDALRRLFRRLKLETVERYLETRAVNAYILTFKSDEGSLSELINCLVDPEKRHQLEGLGLEMTCDGRPKYNYKQYTNHARIGVLPLGWTFEQFYQVFQKDFGRIVKNPQALIPVRVFNYKNRPLRDIELIIHRFGLSGRNYYGFMSPLTQPDAIRKIQELFSEILDPRELTSLIRYEGEIDLPAAILDGSLVELVGRELELSEEERRLLDKRDQELRQAIWSAFGCHSAQELGRALASPAPTAASGVQAGAEIARLLGDSPLFDRARCERIAESYQRTVEAVGNLLS